MPGEVDRERRDRAQRLYTGAKALFAFRDIPEGIKIEIVLPNPERTREPTLDCKNYPLFKHEVSPDDMYSAIRVHSLLTACYGEVVDLSFVDYHQDSESHLVLIGAPYTNRLTAGANYQLKTDGGIYFQDNEPDREIVGRKDKYKIGFDRDDVPVKNRSIVRDYCYLSRRRLSGNRVEIIIAGLRAYGQKASYSFLHEESFYRCVAPVLELGDFQIVVEVAVCNWSVHDWKVVEVNAGSNLEGRIARLSPRQAASLSQYNEALTRLQKRNPGKGPFKDAEVYKEWRENHDPGDNLLPQDTWLRYVRAARKSLGTSRDAALNSGAPVRSIRDHDGRRSGP